MSVVPRVSIERTERALSLVKRIVNDSTGLKVRIHAFVITSSLSLSLATAPTVGVTPAITADAPWWALSAVAVAIVQGLSLVAGVERLQVTAAVLTSMLCFAFSFMTLYESPTSFVAYGFLSLGLCCLLPTLRPLFE